MLAADSPFMQTNWFDERMIDLPLIDHSPQWSYGGNIQAFWPHEHDLNTLELGVSSFNIESGQDLSILVSHAPKQELTSLVTPRKGASTEYITSYLKPFILERYEGELKGSLEILSGPSNSGMVFQFLSL